MKKQASLTFLPLFLYFILESLVVFGSIHQKIGESFTEQGGEDGNKNNNNCIGEHDAARMVGDGLQSKPNKMYIANE